MSAPKRKLKTQIEGAAEDRKHLLACNLGDAMVAFEKARLDLGYADVVVMVLDLRDELAHRIAIAAAGEKALAELLLAVGSRLIPTVVLAVERSLAQALLRDSSPNTDAILAKKVPGQFLVVGIAAGGSAFTRLPIEEVSDAVP